MGTGHLTDDDIQTYLDGESVRENKEIVEHLDSCKTCRSRLAQYRSLYVGLKDDSGFELPADFAERVTSSIGLSKSEASHKSYSNVLVTIMGFLAIIGAIIYFVDIPAILKSFSQVSWTGSLFSKEFIADAKTLLEASTGMLSLLIPGVLALITVWIIDHYLTKSRHKPSSLMI